MLHRHVPAGLAWTFCFVSFVGCGELAGVRDDLELVAPGAGEDGGASGDAAADGPLVCREAETLCSDACVNLSTDPLHCGSCAKACGEGEVCDDARCSTTGCSLGLTDCGGACADLATDELHCGACGRTCKPGESCLVGVCLQDGGKPRDGGPPS